MADKISDPSYPRYADKGTSQPLGKLTCQNMQNFTKTCIPCWLTWCGSSLITTYKLLEIWYSTTLQRSRELMLAVIKSMRLMVMTIGCGPLLLGVSAESMRCKKCLYRSFKAQHWIAYGASLPYVLYSIL